MTDAPTTTTDRPRDPQRGSAIWGQRWLEALERDPAFDARALSIGERVARAHAEPDVRVGPGRADVVVAAGPRRIYHTTVSAPVFADEAWDRLIEHVASSPSRSAALASGALDPALESEAHRFGIHLLPEPGEVTTSCDCAGWASPCKHVAAALFAVADAIDDDPLVLLALRGRSASDLRASLDARRPTSTSPDGVDEPAMPAWLRVPQNVSADAVEVGIEPAATPSWGAPPASAPFTASGLQLIGTDLIRRAAAMVSGQAGSQLDLDPLSDLARLASNFALPDDRRRLAEHSGVSTRELASRAVAWERAGRAGVRAHVHPVETHRVAPNAQVRRVDTHDGDRWFRFEKRSGRWGLIAGPTKTPESLLSIHPIEA